MYIVASALGADAFGRSIVKLTTILRITLGAALALTLTAPALAQTFAQTPQTSQPLQDDSSFTPPPFRVTFEDGGPPPMGRRDDMRRTDLSAEFSFTHFASLSLKAGEVNVCVPFGEKKRQKGIMNPCVVGEFDFGRADGLNALQIFGGVRLEDSDNEKMTFIIEVDGGETHSPGENDFTLKFGGGILFPLQDKKMKVIVQFSIPIIFFPGSHETGFQVSGGITLPIGG
jgi:hypothetical protein